MFQHPHVKATNNKIYNHSSRMSSLVSILNWQVMQTYIILVNNWIKSLELVRQCPFELPEVTWGVKMRTVSPMVVTKSRKPVTVFVTKLVFPVETIFFNHSSWVLEDSMDAVEVEVDVVVVSEESEGSSFVSTEEKMSKEKLNVNISILVVEKKENLFIWVAINLIKFV